MAENLDSKNKANHELSDDAIKSNGEELKQSKSENAVIMNENNANSQTSSAPKNDLKNENNTPVTEEINQRGLEINNINLENTNRPIAGDKCWVINCDIKNTCSFWLSFEKEDISSLKSISLSKPNQKPSIIESFLIDEKRITLKLIISRILQRLNGQKLIGVN